MSARGVAGFGPASGVRRLIPLVLISLVLISLGFVLGAPGAFAQSVVLEFEGVVQSNQGTGGPFAAVTAGDPCSWRAAFHVPGVSVHPRLTTNYLVVPGSFRIQVGDVVQFPPPTWLSVHDNFGSDDSISVAPHYLESGGTQTLFAIGAGGTWFQSPNLEDELGVYTIGPLDVGYWELRPNGTGPVIVQIVKFQIRRPCGLQAEAALRLDAAGLNAVQFSMSLPRLGATWDLQVAAPNVPFASTHVVGFARGADLALGFGSLLVDTSGPELLGLDPMLGSVGTWSVTLPPDPELCGRSLTLQAYGYGLGQFELYNAYDVVIGI